MQRRSAPAVSLGRRRIFPTLNNFSLLCLKADRNKICSMSCVQDTHETSAKLKIHIRFDIRYVKIMRLRSCMHGSGLPFCSIGGFPGRPSFEYRLANSICTGAAGHLQAIAISQTAGCFTSTNVNRRVKACTEVQCLLYLLCINRCSTRNTFL